MTKYLVEKGLLHRAKKGDSLAFGEIIKKYQSLVYAVSFQVLVDPAAARDITQDTFISAFLTLKDLRSEGSFPSWLHSIARNKALALLKERGRIAPLEEAGVIHSPPAPTEGEIEADRNDKKAFEARIRRVILSLSDALRIPILLCYQSDMPTAEAARFLGIREGTLRKRLHDGKKKLQKRIVKMAEQSLQEYRLPAGFARRCICGCERSRLDNGQLRIRKEVIQMADKKSSCGCGCNEKRPATIKAAEVKKPAKKSK
jgi:RNA polymerase sigma factor (sigma-70 family)